ncbi:diguanylate cyclase [Paraburkholderia sp.]|uniref:GGDEF domain-containing protein n=1 Tax=Paraburkholderia sp. TaxID=1926495 RepID=UPI00238904EB|nr:diguanylate cyclase [Paraburkholderia sp.]MDE1179207.1 diguanylate cyclase [Paraburkholderia sp.]
MQSTQTIYSLPRGRLARWLTAPGPETPHDIRVALVGTLFGTLPIFFGGVLNTIAVAWVLAHRHPTLPFQLWLAAEIAVCTIRLCVLVVSRRRAAQALSTPSDLYILLAPLWGATVGYGAFVSAVSGDWVAATLSFLSAAAMVGGICFRNFAAPRLVAVMIFCSLGPCCIGALLGGQPVLLLTLLQIPFYMFAMSVAARRLNGMLISTMKAERENSHRARHDALTGLLNREGLFKAAAQRDTPLVRAGMTLLYLDLDGFKAVNDAYGHGAGDMLLIQVALRLRALSGEQALVARMGGDEFVIIDTVAGGQTPQELAVAIARAIEQPFELSQGLVVTIGASVGIANVRAEDTDIDAVLRLADTAMYDAKRNKKNGARIDHRTAQPMGFAGHADMSSRVAG